MGEDDKNVVIQMQTLVLKSHVTDAILIQQPYYQVLLASAIELTKEPKPHRLAYNLAIILAQTAIEIYTASFFDKLLHKKGLGSQKAKLLGDGGGIDIADRQPYAVYVALTGDPINQHDPLWSKYCNHRQNRNKAVHEEFTATKEQAEHSIEAVQAMWQYLQGKL